MVGDDGSNILIILFYLEGKLAGTGGVFVMECG